MTRATILLTLFVAVACSEPLEFADWIVEVPEGTPIKEYAPVSLDDRAGREIELVEDLVLGGDATDPNTAFYRAFGLPFDPWRFEERRREESRIWGRASDAFCAVDGDSVAGLVGVMDLESSRILSGSRSPAIASWSTTSATTG